MPVFIYVRHVLIENMNEKGPFDCFVLITFNPLDGALTF